MGKLATMFAPERVAVIGASEQEGSVGRAVTANLRADFDGEIVPVNPNAETVLGIDCVDDIGAVEGPVDVAVVVVPSSIAVDVVEACGECGIENVVVITAGFSEAGSDGAGRERRLREVAA